MATPKEKLKAGFKKIIKKFDSILVEIDLISEQSIDHTNYDPRNPESSDGLLTTVRALDVLDQEKHTNKDVQTGDRVFYVDADDVPDIELIDSVEVNSVRHSIVSTETYLEDVSHKLHLRKGG